MEIYIHSTANSLRADKLLLPSKFPLFQRKVNDNKIGELFSIITEFTFYLYGVEASCITDDETFELYIIGVRSFA